MAADPLRAERDDPYPGSAVLAAGIATFFFPVISLIAALLLLSAERPSRRASLRTWAWVSAGWIAAQVLFVVLFLMAFSFGSSSTSGL